MELIKESEWIRVYASGPSQLLYESKFLRDGLQVSAEEIKLRWSNLSPEEQLEFAIAFSAKPSWSDEDGSILDFLMEVGNEYVVQTITDLIARHCERTRAATFMLGRIKIVNEFPLSNYYRVLRTIGDPESLPPLLLLYDEYVAELNGNGNRLLRNPRGYIDYLYLCAALRQLEGSPKFSESIHDLLNHPDEKVRICAQMLLDEL